MILKELLDMQLDCLQADLAEAYELAFPNSGYALRVYGQQKVIRKANPGQLQTWHQS
mgnify:CR=1 FL=1